MLENCLLRRLCGWRMLAKCSLVVGMSVLKDDANLSRRAVSTVLWSMSHPAPFLWHHLKICPKIPVSVEKCPIPLTSLLPACAISGARQCLCPAAWETKLPPVHLVKRENLLVSHQRGAAVPDCLSRLFSPVPGQFPSHSLAFLLTLLVVLLCLGSKHAWVQQVEYFIRNVDCLQCSSQIAA